MEQVLIEWRKKNRLSQQEAAELLGVCQAAYHNWESGKAQPKTKYLVTIAKVCGIDIAKLLPQQG